MANILCVDDEPAAVALKKKILERAGHSVTTSSSANEAIGLLQKETFDAVVTDWNLGEENGRQILLAAKTGVAGSSGGGFGILHGGISCREAAGGHLPGEASGCDGAGGDHQRVAALGRRAEAGAGIRPRG